MAKRIFQFGRPSSRDHKSLTYHSPAASITDEDLSLPDQRRRSVSMDAFFHHHNKEKRKSLQLVEKPPSGKSSPRPGPSKPAKLDIVFESPPLVFIGNTTQSTGALFSGQLRLNVMEVEVCLGSLVMQLLAKVTSKKPVHKDCPDCQLKTTELFKWNMLSEPTKFVRGTHLFPFSYLLPGHLTATTHSQLGKVDYSLVTRADIKSWDAITTTHAVEVKRALVPPETDRTSIRIFPPTNLKAEVTHPPLIHPIGEFKVQLRLTGLVSSDPRFNSKHRWRLRKMFWRIDEHSKWVSPACPKHAPKLGGEGKGILHNETRNLGSDDLKSGWKSDFSEGGSVEMEFPCRLKQLPVCDIDNPAGMEVSHRLNMEIVVSEEVAPANTIANSKAWSASGTARVLRVQFTLVVTERLGLGISWDEEQPPIYEDVPGSPPGYMKMDDYSGGPLPEDDLNIHN